MAKAKAEKKPAEPKVEQIELSSLTIDPALQMRAESPSSEEYQELLSKSKNEWPFNEPLRAVRVDADTVLLYEGFTRAKAALDARWKKVPVETRDGTREDAIILALGTNATHGFRRTRADKKKAVEVALRQCKLSPMAAASQCNVSRSFVYEVKADLEGREKKQASAPAKARGLVKEPCPVCGTNEWIEHNDGLRCEQCQHVYGEAAADDGDEGEWEESLEPDTSERVQRSDANFDVAGLQTDMLEKGLKACETERGRLVRALENVGLLDDCRKHLQAIQRVIMNARESNAKQERQPA